MFPEFVKKERAGKEEKDMSALNPAWLPRVEKWIELLKADFYRPVGEIALVGFETDEKLSAREAGTRPFGTIEPERGYARPFAYLWVKGQIVIPEACKQKRVAMQLDFGAEATLYINGKAFGTYRTVEGASEVRQAHHFTVDNVLTRSAAAGESYELLAEIYCMPRLRDGNYHATGPIRPESREGFTDHDNRIHIGRPSFGIWEEEAYQLYLDASVLLSLLRTLPEKSLRAQKIARALKRFTVTVDFEQDREERLRSYRCARELLRDCLNARNGDSAPLFYAIGNSHLDLAWLWRLSETERKTLRTFAAQLRHMEEYPEYKFIQSQPAAYEMCRRNDPELFEKIRQAVKKGSWIAEGAMWVEPDMNLPSGESLIRQILYGKRFFKEEFGVDSVMLWLPDTFGYNASLPQILSGCGIKYMVTAKILWNYNGHAPFREQLFVWKGNDGSEVTVFIPQTYVCGTDPQSVSHLWDERAQVEDMDAYMLPFGYGDGGGGPCRDDIEMLRREADLEGMPRIVFASPLKFFEDNVKKDAPLHIYAKELYFAAHQGTYTGGAEVKRANRKLEMLFKKAELLGTIALVRGKSTFDYDGFDALWKSMLLHQFHDILPGSSIAEVYEDTRKAHGEIRESLNDCIRRFTGSLSASDGFAVYNSAGWDRSEVVELPQAYASGVRDIQGNILPLSRNGGRVYALVRVPASGWMELVPCTGKGETGQARLKAEGAGYRMENEFLSALIDKDGTIRSLVLRESGHELASGAMNTFRLYKDVPHWFDAWDIHESYKSMQTEPGPTVCEAEICEGLRVSLKIKKRIGKASVLEQRISLDAGSRLLRFDTRVDWQETHRLLKVSFPINIKAHNMINDIQYGYVEHPLIPSDADEKNKFEVCNHRYSALADGSRGAALINDCKYGISAEGSELSLSLLRASMAPQIDMDKGTQVFSYALLLWEGSFAESDASRKAYEFNAPLETGKGSGTYSAFAVDADNIIIDAVKPASDRSGEVIVRVYESQARPTSVTLRTGMAPQKAWLCDMLENRKEEMEIKQGAIVFDIGVFEVKTLRLKL